MARILVIDDDASITRVTREHLLRDGHTVIEACDGSEAMQILREIPVDLVITDLYMPNMDGIEFTIRLGQLKPETKIVAMSGGGYKGKEEVLAMARSLGVTHTLEKPFTRDQLLDAVRAATRDQEGPSGRSVVARPARSHEGVVR